MRIEVVSLFFLALPLLIAGICHALTVRFGLFEYLKIPLSQKYFGANKTVRGFIVFPICTLFGIILSRLLIHYFNISDFPYYSSVNPLTLGFLLGFSYMFFELPNSYLKRRLGIPPGKRPQKGKIFFTLLDQTDSVLGSFLVLWLYAGVPLALLAWGLLFGILIHGVVNVFLFLLGVRNEAF